MCVFGCKYHGVAQGVHNVKQPVLYITHEACMTVWISPV